MKDINDLRRERKTAAAKMEETANAVVDLEASDTAATVRICDKRFITHRLPARIGQPARLHASPPALTK